MNSDQELTAKILRDHMGELHNKWERINQDRTGLWAHTALEITASLHELRLVCFRMAQEFKKTSPDFSLGEFLEACGYGKPM